MLLFLLCFILVSCWCCCFYLFLIVLLFYFYFSVLFSIFLLFLFFSFFSPNHFLCVCFMLSLLFLVLFCFVFFSLALIDYFHFLVLLFVSLFSYFLCSVFLSFFFFFSSCTHFCFFLLVFFFFNFFCLVLFLSFVICFPTFVCVLLWLFALVLVTAVCFSFWCLSWILFVYCFLFPFFFFIFLWSHCEASVHLVLCPGVRSGLLGPDHWVQCWTTREFLSLGILTLCSPGGIHFNTKIWLLPIARRLQCWRPHANQGVRQEDNPPISRQIPQNYTKPTDTPKHTTWSGPAHQRGKTQLYPPEGRFQFFPPGSLLKPLDQACWPWGRQ